jgi:hypothetical protein
VDAELHHAFLSYRWSDGHDTLAFDSNLVAKLADAFSLQALGGHGERLSVFYDRRSLKTGHEFDVGYKLAMTKTLVVCPLVTPHALRNLGCSDGVDNVLCEWLLAQHLYDEGKIASIVPVFAGEVGLTGVDVPICVPDLGWAC